jgi:tRNA (guanine6-N2)-methyltransferase
MKIPPKQSSKPNSIRLFARTVRGAEWIGAAEIEGRIKAKITDLRHREIRFQVQKLETSLLDLGSVDDIFLIGSNVQNIDHTRASLSLLSAQASAIDFETNLAFLRQIRSIPRIPTFTVVASFLGRRNYNRFEIEGSIANAIRAKTNWHYFPQEVEQTEHADVTFRVHLSDRGGVIGLRLSLTPLHRRKYKVASRTGTLHPPLAFAMAMLCGTHKGSIVLDPCCGVGTIPIEASSLEPLARVIGSDIDIETAHNAAINAQEANQNVTFVVADAGGLPVRESSVDRIICNPPWGRAVNALGLLEKDPNCLFMELGRILKLDGRIVLIDDNDIIKKTNLHRFDLKLAASIPISLFGVWPSISIIAHRASPHVNPIDITGRFGTELAKYWLQSTTY